MRDCEIVAKSLVAKYSFLKEHVSSMLYTSIAVSVVCICHIQCAICYLPVTVIVATRGSTQGCRMGY